MRDRSNVPNSVYEWSGYATGTVNATADGLNRDAALAALANGYDRGESGDAYHV